MCQLSHRKVPKNLSLKVLSYVSEILEELLIKLIPLGGCQNYGYQQHKWQMHKRNVTLQQDWLPELTPARIF